MKLTIERQALIKALGHVQSVVERRNTIPILSNVLLSADKDGLALSATDLDMEIVDETPARIDTAGQITAPAHTLYEIVRNSQPGGVNLHALGPPFQVVKQRLVGSSEKSLEPKRFDFVEKRRAPDAVQMRSHFIQQQYRIRRAFRT